MWQDIFDGLVAAGTLALAGVTYRLARSTSGSVREAYKSRIDASAHRVVVHGFAVWDNCANPRIAERTDPHLFDLGIDWDLSQHGGTYIGLPASTTVTNEGAVSALVEVSPSEGVELWLPTVPASNVGVAQLSWLERQGDGAYLLPPGKSVEVRLIWWQAGDRWALAADAGGVPLVTARVAIRDAMRGATDACELTFGAQVLWRHPTHDGWMIAARDMTHVIENPPDPPIATVGQLVRSYPGEPKPLSWQTLMHRRAAMPPKHRRVVLSGTGGKISAVRRQVLDSVRKSKVHKDACGWKLRVLEWPVARWAQCPWVSWCWGLTAAVE